MNNVYAALHVSVYNYCSISTAQDTVLGHLGKAKSLYSTGNCEDFRSGQFLRTVNVHGPFDFDEIAHQEFDFKFRFYKKLYYLYVYMNATYIMYFHAGMISLIIVL